MEQLTDIKEALTGVLDYLKTSAGDKWPEVEGQAMKYLGTTEERLLLVANESLTGQLEPKFLLARAKDELVILESEAIALGIITASASQEIINSAIQKLLVIIIDFLLKKINL